MGRIAQMKEYRNELHRTELEKPIGERNRRGVVLYAEVTPEMKRTLRRLSYEWEISQADIVIAAIEQYLASQAIVMEKV